MDTLGSRLKALRTDRGMTQEDLAKLLNVSRVSVVNWEQDTSKPKKIYEIAKIFDVSPEFLASGKKTAADVEADDSTKISRAERVMIERYRKLDPAQKQAIDTMFLTFEKVKRVDAPQPRAKEKATSSSSTTTGEAAEQPA